MRVVTINLDKERHLCLTLNAMVQFGEVTGVNLFQKSSMQDISPKDLRALLWACLIREDKQLSLEQVGEMVHAGNFLEVAEALGKVWEAAMPKGDGTGPLPG